MAQTVVKETLSCDVIEDPEHGFYARCRFCPWVSEWHQTRGGATREAHRHEGSE